MQIQKLLLATDFSPASERAREVALQLAKTFDAELTVLHVVEPPAYAYAVPLPDSVRPAVAEALEGVAESVRRAGLRTQRILREGSPSAEIVAAVEENGLDLVILGTHGHRGLNHLLLGSVSEKVVRLSAVPVLTVPPWRFANPRAAGRELAQALQPLRTERPLVMALSRGNIPIAHEVAKSFETSLDVLLVREIEHGGRVLGAVDEDGTSLLDEKAVSQSAIPREKVGNIVEASRQSCRDEAIALRGARWIIDVSNRTVVVVCEAPTSEWPAAVAAAMFRKMGSPRIVTAAPAISAAVVPSIARHVDEVVCVERVQDPAMMAMLYRNRRDPSDREAVELLSLQPKANA